jgi:hypothetical protein
VISSMSRKFQMDFEGIAETHTLEFLPRTTFFWPCGGVAAVLPESGATPATARARIRNRCIRDPGICFLYGGRLLEHYCKPGGAFWWPCRIGLMLELRC